MIGALRRKFENSDEGDDWPLEVELKPEVVDPSQLVGQMRPPVQAWPTATFSPHDSSSDYYEDIVKAAIARGGEYSGHHIPIPWLKMILAGMEYKQVEMESLWDGVDEGRPADASSYYTFFPSEERESPVGPSHSPVNANSI